MTLTDGVLGNINRISRLDLRALRAEEGRQSTAQCLAAFPFNAFPDLFFWRPRPGSLEKYVYQ